MYPLLSGLRIVEGSAFVAGPTCALYLLQLGAEVIRFDPIGGGPDFRRWPLSPKSGASLYWEGLNKGKKSIALDLARPEGRELAQRLAAAPGEGRGLFVTNYPVDGFLAHGRLARLRPDLVSLRVMGWADGRPAVDYTINAAAGVPWMTGSPEQAGPVNHVLPAWDLLTGAYAAFALVAAEGRRRRTGEGAEIRLPLSDVAAGALANLGQLAEVLTGGGDRPRIGNALFGAFGRDFGLKDGGRVMVVAITARQWRNLLACLDLAEPVAVLERELGLDFAADEGARFEQRGRLFPLFEAAFAGRTAADLDRPFAEAGVCWAPYRTLAQAAADPSFAAANPVFAQITQPSGETYPAPGPYATFAGETRASPVAAPRLGEHTDEILAEVLGLTGPEIARLHDTGLVASAF